MPYLENLKRRRKQEIDELYTLAGWESPLYQYYVHQYDVYLPDGSKEQEQNGVPVIGMVKGLPPVTWVLLVVAIFTTLAMAVRLRQTSGAIKA